MSPPRTRATPVAIRIPCGAVTISPSPLASGLVDRHAFQVHRRVGDVARVRFPPPPLITGSQLRFTEHDGFRRFRLRSRRSRPTPAKPASAENVLIDLSSGVSTLAHSNDSAVRARTTESAPSERLRRVTSPLPCLGSENESPISSGSRRPWRCATISWRAGCRWRSSQIGSAQRTRRPSAASWLVCVRTCPSISRCRLAAVRFA